MKLEAFMAVMESIAPAALAMDFDNVGLLIGPEKKDIRRVLVALDCTAVTVREAVEKQVDLLLTHHPLFFEPVRRIMPDLPETSGAYALIRNGIGLFAAHTNLDAAAGGVNDRLSAVLGITNVTPLPPDGLGRIGDVKDGLTLSALARLTAARLSTDVRIVGEPERTIRRAALIGGSGGGDVYAAKEAGADVLITGEIKHHQALCALETGLAVIEAGHYETERVVLLPLIERLQGLTDDVQYELASCETRCLHGLREVNI